MKIKKLNTKGVLKQSIDGLGNQLPLFFKNPKIKESSIKIDSSNFVGLDEFCVYKSKRSSCQPFYKSISKLQLDD